MLDTSESSARGIRNRIKYLGKKYYALVRAAEFAVASIVRFVVMETMIIVGVFEIYHSSKMPRVAFLSSSILELYVAAFVIGERSLSS